MKKLFLIVLVGFSTFSFSQSNREAIKELLVEMKTTSTFEKMLNFMITNAQKSYSDIPASFWTELKKEANPNLLIEKMIPIYEKHFTSKEIEDLIAFYKSPTGQSMIDKQTVLFQEVNKIGEEWGYELAKKIMDKAGVKPNYGNPPPPKIK